MLDLLIVGAGPAGCAAAVQARRLGLHPLLVDATGRAGGLITQAWQVENYPGLPPLPGPAVARLLQEHLQRFELGVHQDEVHAVLQQEDHLEIRCASGPTRARAVIAAVGTAPIALPVSGPLPLVYGAREALALHPQRAAVVGSGEAGLDYALSLAQADVQVEVLVRGASMRARGRLVDLATAHPRIRIRPHTHLLRSLAEAVEITDPEGTRILQTDVLVAAIGRRSRLADLGIDARPGAEISACSPGLYLAGDARSGGLGQLGMAVGDGLAAAMAAALELRP